MSFTAAKNKLITDQKGGGLKVFLIALLCAACFILPFMIVDGGYFLYYGDFNVQQIPFYQLCHEAIRSGELGWSFGTDLGANFIGSYTFYTITSPFFLLTLPFPNSWVPYFMGPLLILKFACAALTAFLYIRRYTRKRASAQLGALLYAFSGFSIYNVFFNHFHEAIVFFPLLLLAFDLLTTENRRGVFALMVAVCGIVNYFFFVGMLVFGLIYMIIRIASRAIRPGLWQYFAIFFELLLGILLATFILLPSYLAIADNSRVSELDLGWNSIFFGKESIYGNVIEVFFFPPDLPARPVMFPEANVKWSSLGAWMPVFSMVGVFTYCFAKRGSWLKRIIVTCGVMAMVPILNSSFYLFNDSYYVRWFYMPILMMALATAICAEEPDINWKRGFKWVAGITLLITLVIGFFPKTGEGDSAGSITLGLYTEPDNPMYIARFWITCGVALAGLVILALLLKLRKKNMRLFFRSAVICVVVLTVGFSNFYIASGKSHSYKHEMVVDQLIEGQLSLEGDPDTFRIDTYSCMDNSAMFLDYSSINAFHSIVPPTIMDFYKFIGENRDVASRPDTDVYAIRSLLSVKYLIQQEEKTSFTDKDGNTEMPGYLYLKNEGGFDVYENENYLGYGFSYDTYMSYSDCEDLSGRERSLMMMRTILLDESQIRRFGYMFEPLSSWYDENGRTESVGYIDFKQDVADRKATEATSFKTGKNSFTATVTREKDALVFFSIPYDKGWSATVNGEPVRVEKVNVGFMAVPVTAGESEIVFTYETPGLKTGLIVSASALAVLVLYLAAILIYRKKHPVSSRYPEGDAFLENWEKYETEELIALAAEELELTEEDTALPPETDTQAEEEVSDE